MAKKDEIAYKVVNHFDKYHPYLLVVDDNATNRKVASEILKKSGCEVITADSGQKAIKLVQASLLDKPFDIIFMDIQMPGMSGFEATVLLLQHPAAGRASIKVLARPANAFHTGHARYLAVGLNDCLAEPFEEAELYAKLQKLLRRP